MLALATSRVLAAPGFQLSIEAEAPPGGCGLLDALAVGSKRGFEGLLTRATQHIEAKVEVDGDELNELHVSEEGREQLGQLRPAVLVEVALQLLGTLQRAETFARLRTLELERQLREAKRTMEGMMEGCSKLLAHMNELEWLGADGLEG
eukprot:scaffold1.g5192.t1